jgi:hypothetical protein
MVLLLKPQRGGFLRPFGCGWFIREFLMGHGPYGSKVINPEVGAPQSDICFQYKMALIRTTAEDRATRAEERLARRQQRAIDPENIQTLLERYLAMMPYKTTSARFHSFVVYFTLLQRLGWVEETGREEASGFQQHYPPGPPRRYFRLTRAGWQAGDAAWANPRLSLYGQQ